MSKQSEALKAYFKERRIKNCEIAQALDINTSNVSIYLNGKRDIGKRVAKKFAECYGLDMQFLMTGEGSLLPPSPQAVNYGDIRHSPGSQISVNQSSEHAAAMAENEALKKELETIKAYNEKLFLMLENLTKTCK